MTTYSASHYSPDWFFSSQHNNFLKINPVFTHQSDRLLDIIDEKGKPSRRVNSPLVLKIKAVRQTVIQSICLSNKQSAVLNLMVRQLVNQSVSHLAS